MLEISTNIDYRVDETRRATDKKLYELTSPSCGFQSGHGLNEYYMFMIGLLRLEVCTKRFISELRTVEKKLRTEKFGLHDSA